MGAIAGWVDFGRDLSLERHVLDRELAAMASRGTDGEGAWVSPHALLGQRRKATVDPSGGRVPVVDGAGQADAAVAVLDGEISNFRELRSRLRGLGHVFRTGGDAEVLLRSYREWGAECVERLDGTFAFAVWDAARERLLLGRDRLGVKPLFYLPLGEGVVFGSEPKGVLAHPLVDATVDLDGLRELLAFTSTPGRAAPSGMGRVLPGGLVELDRAGLRSRRYWMLTARRHEDDRPDTVRTVRSLLERAVEAQLQADVPVGVLLSGGLDSSSVAALAARAARRADLGPIRTFTASYRGAVDSGSGPMSGGAADLSSAAVVAEHIGARHTHVELDPAEALDPLLRRTAVESQQDMVTAAPQFPGSLRLMCRHVAPDIGVALAGEQADTVFGSFMGGDDPEVLGADTYPWIAATAARLPPDGLGTGLLDRGLLAKLDLPGYLRSTYQDDLARVPVLDGEAPAERRRREMCFLHLQGWQEFGCALDDGVSATSGIMLRWPFCDHRLVEYLFNVPWAMKTFDGQPKSLLRAAVSDLLPPGTLQRAPSPFPTGADPAYPGVLRRELAALLADRSAPVLGWLDVGAAERLVHDAPDPRRVWRDVTDIELVLQLDRWLDRMRVRVAV